MLKILKKIILSPLALCFWIPLIVMISYFAYRHMAPFGTNSILTVDLGQQYIDQFAMFRHTLLAHPSSFFYSFSNALGGDMLSEWAYYLMSPFNLLFLLVTPQHLPSMILIVTVLKFGAAGLSFGWVIQKLKFQNGYSTLLFAINYALSGWFIANDLNLLWLDAAILLPLVIYHLERLFTQKKWWRYSLILAATIISNYYIGYMIALFVCLYFIWRLTWTNQIQSRWLTIRHFIMGSLVAGGLSAWLILPTFYQLRLGKAQYQSTWHNGFDNNPLHLLFKLIPGSFNFDQMQQGVANIFVSSLILITALLFFISHRFSKSVKLGALCLLSILILATTWAPLTLVFHGMQYPVWYPYRFSFMISFFLIWLGAMAWKKTEPLSYKTVFVLLLSYAGIILYAWQQDKTINYINHTSILVFAVLALVMLYQLSRKQHDHLWLIIITCLTITELSVNTKLTLDNFSYLTNTEYKRTVNALQEATNVLKQDKSWYRVAQTYERTRGDGMMLDFYGAAHFSSALSKSTPLFFNHFGQAEGDNYVLYSNGTLLSDSLLGMKYIVSPNGKDKNQPGDPTTHIMANRPDTSAYKRQKVTAKNVIWQNPYSLPVAFAAPKAVTSVKMLSNSPIQNQNNLWQSITGDSIIQAVNFTSAVGHNVNAPSVITNAVIRRQNKQQPASLDLTFTPQSSGSYYLTLGGSMKISDFNILLNNQVIKQFDSYRHTVIINLARNVKNKPQTLTFQLKNQQQLNLENVTLYALNQNKFQDNVANIKSNALTITHRNERQISGTITTTTRKPTIFTTIPAAPGWHAEVDGKAIAIKKSANYFITIPTKAGHHHIKLTYTPPLLREGIILSIIAILLLLIDILYRKSQRHLH